MQSISALSLAPDVNDWLVNSRHPRILHIFERACNLINERREVLSIVAPQIGNGPFNLVIEDSVFFSEHLDLQSPISNSDVQLRLGDLTINTAGAKLWSPRPDWEGLHAVRTHILKQLTQFSNSPISNLLYSLAIADLPSSLTATQKLAGLGAGLTPSGDDFIIGAIYAAWIIHPPEIARVLALEITQTAAPLTTSLSAAWLKSAGRGEAGTLWHEFFDALISVSRIVADPDGGRASPTYRTAVQKSVDKILAVGETSGVDALSGFINTFLQWADTISPSPFNL